MRARPAPALWATLLFAGTAQAGPDLVQLPKDYRTTMHHYASIDRANP